MQKHWKALTAVGVVIVAVAVAVILISRPTPSAEQEPSSLQASGMLGFPDPTHTLGVVSKTTAGDGKTITGYSGTCDSAAQAAANFAPLLSEVNLKTWADQKKTLTEVSVPGPWFEKVTSGGDLMTTTKNLPSGAFDGGWVSRSDVAAGGLYRVASCEEKKRAVVQVFIGSLNAQVKTVPAGGFGTVPMELTWDGDWKITDARQSADDPNFGGRVQDRGPAGATPGEPTGDFPVLTQDLVNSVFADVRRDGWIEYANAKR